MSFPHEHAFVNRIKDVPVVGDLSFVDFTDTTIGIRWTPVNYPAVTGYHITVVPTGQSSPILEDVVNSSSSYYMVRGLEPGINFDITVTSITDDAESKPSVITQQTQSGELFHIGSSLRFSRVGIQILKSKNFTFLLFKRGLQDSLAITI